MRTVAFAPDGRLLASTDSGDAQIIFATLTDGSKLQMQRRWRLPGFISSLAFTPEGKHLATGNSNGTIYLLS